MTYYGGKQLAAAFRTVRNNTIKIAEEIPEGKYDFRPSPDTRSVQQTLAHVAVSTGFQHHVQSNKIADLKTINFPEMFQKFSAGTRIFGQNQIDFFQNTNGSESHILEITDWRGNYI